MRLLLVTEEAEYCTRTWKIYIKVIWQITTENDYLTYSCSTSPSSIFRPRHFQAVRAKAIC